MAGKWTKGPWRVEGPRFFHSGDHTLTSVEIAATPPGAPFRGNICYAQSCEQIGGIYGGEVMANARLIAQAPAMAEALEDAREWMRSYLMDDHPSAAKLDALLTAIKGE